MISILDSNSGSAVTEQTISSRTVSSVSSEARAQTRTTRNLATGIMLLVKTFGTKL